jgi:iron complex transport system substrate-binding protein
VAAGLVMLACAAAAPVWAAPRVISLDGCADQYVLGLVPTSDILALSGRSRLLESFYRDRAAGIRQIRPDIEDVLALRPDIVVRTWGGDLKLIKKLQQNNIKIINISDINSYNDAENELRRVGHELGRDDIAGGEASRFRAALADIRPLGLGRSVLYYTPGGFTAGPDTMVGDMLRHLDFRLESQDKGYHFLSPEVLLSLKPDVFALGFYEDRYAMRRVPGRNPEVAALIDASPHFTLPARAVACSGWFTAYDLETLSRNVLK